MTTRSRSLARLLCVGLLLLVPGLVLAGPNEGGTLILHANPSLVFTTDTPDYCGMSALDSCAAAVTSVPWESEKPVVFHVIAAFPPGSSPRLKAISFGIDYDSTKFMLAARGSCADFEVPGTGWPAHGTGTSQSWTAGAQTGLLTEVYWLCGYAYSEQEGEDSTSVSLIPHPLQHGVFVDDAFPSEADTIAGYGRLGFGMAGAVPCPDAGGDVVWIESDELDVSTPDGDPEGDEPGDSSGDDAHADTVRVSEFSTNVVSAWIEPSAIQFDQARRQPLPLSQVPWLDTDVRLTLESYGAELITKEFPGYGPGDTLGLDYRQMPVRMPDKSGYFLITFPSVLDAARCATVLNRVPGVGVASLLDAARVQTFDQYFDSFPLHEPRCYEGLPGCARNPQWHLHNPYPGRLSSYPSCATAVTGLGVDLPETWPVEYPEDEGQTVLGLIDTGVAEDHPDLKPWPIPQAWREILLNHPLHDWCGGHGTAMAGLAAARGNNGIGIAGLCSNCFVLDMESASTFLCDTTACTAHNNALCSNIGGWTDKVPFVSDNMGPELASLLLSFAGPLQTVESQVVALWHAHRSGILCTAPSSDQFAQERRKSAPANIPFVLGIGGFTHDGRYWDYNTTCTHDSLMSTPGPGIDICFPASPGFVTTIGGTFSQPPYADRYYWTTGQCSGAAAMATAAIGLFREMRLFKQENGVWCQETPPDDIAGILEATAQPWDPSPLTYSVCGPGDCLESDFGKGRVDLNQALRLWEFLYCEGAAPYATHHLCVRWNDPGVRIDSTSFAIGDTLVREYEVSKVVPIPLSKLYLEGVPTQRLAWIIRDRGWPSMETPTSLLAYGDTMDIAGKRERFRLAAVHGITDGQLGAVNQTSGLATVTGHNFARVYRDGQGHEQIQYVVPPSQFKIVYAVITFDDMARVDGPDARGGGPAFTHVPTPGTGTMRVAYSLPSRGRALVHLYDASGREQAKLIDEEQEAGEHWFELSGPSGAERRVARGVYWLVLRLDAGRDVRRLVIVN